MANTQQQYEMAHEVLTSILDCGWADTDYLMDKLLDLEHLTNLDISDVMDNFKANYDTAPTANDLIYTTMDLIAQEIFSKAFELAENDKEAEKVKKVIEEKRDNFSPFINSLDSWYNNEIDQLDLSKDLETVAQDFIDEIMTNEKGNTETANATA